VQPALFEQVRYIGCCSPVSTDDGQQTIDLRRLDAGGYLEKNDVGYSFEPLDEVLAVFTGCELKILNSELCTWPSRCETASCWWVPKINMNEHDSYLGQDKFRAMPEKQALESTR
jgi:hypothetical protein